ncbi:MMPL family transporter [Nesterenkonia alba]|uniref:MMPL family transporter n=1 Tax=Nesterenkonia alba TaxID=515814 RepID=UPI0003B59290|nr:MMPL family transporter [Nesterenkonia alba]
MSHWLSGLGRVCARFAKSVVALWLLLAAVAAAAAAVFTEGTTASYTIPDAEYERVLDDLGEEIEEFSGGTVPVVLSSTDGFTTDQQQAIADLSEHLEALDHVAAAEDPFAVQEDLDEAADEITEGRDELDAAEGELDDSEAELAAAEEELSQAQQELDTAAEAGLDVSAEQAELEAQQAEIDAGYEEITEGREEIAEERETLRRAEDHLEVTEQLQTVSEDGTVALLSVRFVDEAYNLTPEEQDAVVTAVEDQLPAGVDADYGLELVQDVTAILGPSEIIGVGVAALVLFITLGTVVAAGLPVMLALIGVGVGVAGIYAVSRWVEMTDTDPILALMLGLSLGIDYTLLLLWRHRRLLAQGYSVHQAAATACAHAGPAIFFAGVTNVIALGALAVTGIPFLTVMGLAASATILIVVAAVLTLAPALFSLLGHRLIPQHLREEARDDALGSPPPTPESNRLSEAELARLEPEHRRRVLDTGWGRFVTRHRWLAILGPLLILGTLALPAADLRLGLPDGASEPEDSTAYQAYDTIREQFGPGENGPLIAAVQLPGDLTEEEQEDIVYDLATDLTDREGISYAAPTAENDEGTVQVLQAVPETGPNEEETNTLVTSLIEEAETLATDYGAEEIGFTGTTVANIEISERILEAIPLYVGIVVVLCLVILAVVFRSLVAPVLAAAGYVLSLAASLGAVTAIYQWGWLNEIFGVSEPAPILAFLPILMSGLLFGLAVDYQLFIMSGVYEAHRRGADNRLAVLEGLRLGGPVVAACGIIMVSVFAGFVFADLTMIRPIGFGLALGVLLDAFLVRATLIPAATSLLGRVAWWGEGFTRRST